MSFTVRGIPQSLADEVRRTRRAPDYGHPAHHEIATGTGPCRCCLRPFVPGVDARLLFTYRPRGDGSSLMAPGPVFIHAEHCAAFDGAGFPDGLRALPLAIEARATDSRVVALTRADARAPVESGIATLLESAGTDWLHLRHAEAGCYIARVDRVAG
ncbi:MAG TPA: DUF1203 domain-containing protein [Steroidobacteraceae bacterium]|nr:DUF1203 domain-containing protein [Steroidobacteraceae bacterium]